MKENLSMKHRLLFLCKLFGAVFYVPVLGLVLFMIPWLWKMPVHNINLHVFQQQFDGIQHPYKSQLLAKHKAFGNFGNSNHCDYFFGEFRESDLPREDIINNYTHQYIAPPDDSLGVWSGPPPTKTDIEVYFLNDRIFEHWPWSDWLEKHVSQLPEDRKNAYLVFASEDGYPPIGDLRCH